ncbi:MAG: aconitase X catalytic domain-containing protein [Treponema sp.]|jgi:predicted aconitase|nr:aconitase X catalytic domain-containing protein [Treponema sp.]
MAQKTADAAVKKPAVKKPAAKAPAARKSAAAKKPAAAKKSVAKPAAKKPSDQKTPAAKKPSAKAPAARKPAAAKKPAAKPAAKTERKGSPPKRVSKTAGVKPRAKRSGAEETSPQKTVDAPVFTMKLTKEEAGILAGEKGKTLARVMKTLVMYGETFGAEKMVPVTGAAGHLVTSFGLSVMKPLYALMDNLIREGVLSSQKFTVDPRPLDINVPVNLAQKILFGIMYSKQAAYEEQLRKLGLVNDDGFTCTCYMSEVGNIPKKGDVLSWAESSAVVYANSVLGARCNRNSGIIELFGSIAGRVPCFGLLTDEGRRASWIIEVRTKQKPEAQLLGSAVGMKVMEAVPFIRGLDRWIGRDLNRDTEPGRAASDYLKDMGAAAASNGAVGLYHVENLTPEAKTLGSRLILKKAPVYVIDDAELERVKRNYPCIWKDPAAEPGLCFVGCPHLSLDQLKAWTARVLSGLEKSGRRKLSPVTVFTAAPAVLKEFRKLPEAARLQKAGAVVSDICPLMYMNNPLCGKMPVITNSNKLRTYTSSRYYTDDEITAIITGSGAAAGEVEK